MCNHEVKYPDREDGEWVWACAKIGDREIVLGACMEQFKLGEPSEKDIAVGTAITYWRDRAIRAEGKIPS